MKFQTHIAIHWTSGWPRPGASRAAVRARCHVGAAATEFAIVCPLVLLLALGCADFGRIAYYYEVVANAAQTGAETGATQQFTDYTHASWENRIKEAVLNELENIPQFDASKLSYNLVTTTDSDGIALISIDVSYPFRTAVTWPGLPAATQLHKHIAFRQFR